MVQFLGEIVGRASVADGSVYYETSRTPFETSYSNNVVTSSIFQMESRFKQYHLLTENMPPKT